MRVGIFGCGYIGLALGKQLIECGYEVFGIRRSTEGLAAVKRAGLNPIQADITDKSTLSKIPAINVIVFAASPTERGHDAAKAVYDVGVANVCAFATSRIDDVDRILYTSSTGVYGDHNGAWISEETPIDPTRPRARLIAEAENRVRSVPIDSTIVRFAGLYGPNRYRLDRYLDGPVTAGILNMIHRDDAAGSIRHLIESEFARNEIILAVDDEPVSKWRFADWLAAHARTHPPRKITVEERLSDGKLPKSVVHRIQSRKRCSNDKLRSLGYDFEYPTFREGYAPAITAKRGESSYN